MVLLKDGGFLAGWQYQGEDRESATAQELAVLSARVNTVLTRLGTGWMLQVEAVRRKATAYSPTGAFPDRTTLTLDQARREHYQTEGTHYVSTYALWLTWWPPEEATARAAGLFLEGQEQQGAAQQVTAFQASCREWEDALAGTLRLRRLQEVP